LNPDYSPLHVREQEGIPLKLFSSIQESPCLIGLRDTPIVEKLGSQGM